MASEATRDSVRSVERALTILQCFTLDESALTLMEIARKMDLPMSTTVRIVSTLQKMGFLDRNADKTYSLGSRAYSVGCVARAHFRIQKVAYPFMVQIRDATKEAVSLYGFEGESRVCYEHVPSLLSMRCVVRPGDHFPLFAGAAGKCLLAYASPEIVEREIANAYPITGTTIVDRDAFLKNLADIRENGYAISYGEREEGITSIAVPIFYPRGKATVCLSVAGPSVRFTDPVIRELLPWISRLAADITKLVS